MSAEVIEATWLQMGTAAGATASQWLSAPHSSASTCEKPIQRRRAGSMTRATASRTAGKRLRIPVWNSVGSSSTIRNWLNVKPPGMTLGGTGVLMR
jgi:hypothetical protein